ncbi:MAG TPA: M48 family metalloprotease [Pseudolabrys sp.]|nr:M48 family metalloprotease [Pseudolabrys sp.]
MRVGLISAVRGKIRVLAVALAAALAGCSSLPQTGKVSLHIPEATRGPSNMSAAEEREHLRILASYGGQYDDARVQKLVNDTVHRLAAASSRPDIRFRVTILNSPAVNAFALPNGHLYITRGLVALANDESELASVLGHEMGHVIAHHAQIREEKARQAALISHVVSDVLSDPQVGALALAKSKLALATFSRTQEFEADAIGIRTASHAGFDPYGAARFLNDMQRNADLKSGRHIDSRMDTTDFLSDHPSTPDRVKKALIDARHYSGPGIGARDRNVYLADLNGMVFGEDPSEGFVRGRRFVHPKLGFTFTAPQGFTLDNTAQAVLGLKDGGDEAMRLDVVSVPAEQSLAQYLDSGWIEHVDPASPRGFTINGFPAATARASGKDWSFRLFAVRFGSDVYRFIFAAKTMTPAADRSFRASVESFRRLTLKEQKAVRPQRIKIVSVGPNDTVESMAARMAVANHRAARFRVLNGLGAKQTLKPGEKVKIVVE